MQSSKKYKVECYSPPWYGHTIPISKIAQLIQDNLSNVDIKVVTFQLQRPRLQKDFKTVKYEFLYPEVTAADQDKKDSMNPVELFAQIYVHFEDYLNSKKELPDLIISDMFSVASMHFARKHNIPLIVLFPQSYQSAKNMFSFLSLSRSFNIEGFLVSTPLARHVFFDTFSTVLDASRGHARLIFQSFIGLDEPSLIPSNHTLIGLLPNRSYSELTPELKQWIEGWKAKGKNKFLYVSFGSILKLSLNFAKRLAEGFIKAGYPTIWSLRAPNSEEIQDPLIFHKSWLPQQAILRLPEVRGYLTHCGWGSITEAVMTKTPLICVPSFADQPGNAELISKKSIGTVIYQTDNFQIAAQLQVDLPTERICGGVTEVLEGEIYIQSIEKLNRMCNLHRTTQNVCRVVTESLEFGNGHLIHPLTESVTVKTGYPLSRIIKEQYLPKNAQ